MLGLTKPYHFYHRNVPHATDVFKGANELALAV
jgi:hypothetical protein